MVRRNVVTPPICWVIAALLVFGIAAADESQGRLVDGAAVGETAELAQITLGTPGIGTDRGQDVVVGGHGGFPLRAGDELDVPG